MAAGVRKFTVERSEALEHIRAHWLSNLSHSLSSPLFTARGYVRLMLQDESLSQSHRRYLGVVLENIDKLVALARELNEFPSPENFDLMSFGLRDVLLDAVKEAGVKVKGEISESPMNTTGDRRKLGQALRGFLAAAAQCAGSEGPIELSAGQVDGQITVRVTAGRAHSFEGPQPDLFIPTMLWRLHGGSICADWSEERYSIVCDLPVIQSTTVARAKEDLGGV